LAGGFAIGSRRHGKVGFRDDLDARRRTMNAIDDYLYDDLKGAKGVALATKALAGA
jgi:type I restriction enzyme R subunit